MNFKVVVLIISLAVVIILFTIVLCVAITRSIVHPVDEVKRAANAIANGQLKTELTYTSENELGQLADDIRSTAEALNQYVSEVEKGLTALGEGKLNYKPEVVFKGDFIALGNAMEKITGLLYQGLPAADWEQCRACIRRSRSRYPTERRRWPGERPNRPARWRSWR